MAVFTDKDIEAFQTGGGSAASVFAGIGSYFATTHKVLSLVLASVGLLFLIITAYLNFKRTTSGKMTYALMSLAVLTLVFYSYRDLHQPAIAIVNTTSQQGPNVTNSATTSKGYSPANAGNGNVVNYASAPPSDRKKRK